LRVAAAEALLEFDPTHEPALSHLMTALIQLGDRARAIREYARCERALHAVGLFLSSETTSLYQTVSAAPPERQAVPEARSALGTPAQLRARSAASAGRPLIAVLPFRSLSIDDATDYAGAGLFEDLVEMMSRVSDIAVISRLSTVAVEHNRSPHEIGAALGAEYVLSGSVKAIGNRLCLTAELTDGRSGVALWSSRQDRRFSSLFDAQQQAAESIVRGAAPRIHGAELSRARLKHPEEREAYDLFLCARADTHNFSRAVFDSAGPLFDQALERDPRHAEALAWRAYWHLLRVGQGWSNHPAYDVDQADQFARRSVECDRLNPMALAIKGHVAAYLRRDFETAYQALDTALQIDPKVAPAWLWSAAAHAYTGHGSRAVHEIERAMALSPHDSFMYAYTSIASLACLADGQAERGLKFALHSVRENPSYTTGLKLLITSLVQVGRGSEAEVPAQQLLALEPGFSVEQFRRLSPTSASELGEVFCGALTRAGIPVSG
jgi:TolB-like protein